MRYIKLYEDFSFNRITSNPKIKKVICDSYLETAIWACETNNPHLENKTIYDFTDNAIEQAKEEIRWFIDSAFELLDSDEVFDDVSYTSIGHDLWLSRNHEGSGFFDRSEYDDETLNILKVLSHKLDDISVEADNNNDKLYFDMYSEKYKDFDISEYKEKLELERTAKKYNVG